MKKISLVLFDMDGVLFSSEPILHRAYSDAVSTMNQRRGSAEPVPSEEQIFAHVGKPVRQLFAELFPHLDEDVRNDLNQHVLRYLVDNIGEGIIYPNTADTLAKLSGNWPVALASNGRSAYLKAICSYFDLQQFLQPGYSIHGTIHNKLQLVAAYGQNLDFFAAGSGKNPPQIESTPIPDPGLGRNILVVGDRSGDLEAARSNGCHFIGVTWGHGSLSEVETADFLAHDMAELADIISNEFTTSQ